MTPETTERNDKIRTTVLLNQADRDALRELSELSATTDMEAIRRAIRLARDLRRLTAEGGEIVLRRGRTTERLIFY